jgi:hypothetical protein
METEKVYEFAFSNECMCADGDYNDDFVMFEALEIDCEGECWESALEDFKDITSGLFEQNETMWWKVSNLALWDGNHSGYGQAKDAESLLNLMTVNSGWHIKGKVFNDRIEYSLSHHDSMGSKTVVTMISDEQREELGLY